MTANVYVTQPIGPLAMERLSKLANVSVNTDDSQVIPKETLIAGVRKADILFSLLHDRIDADVLRANPKLRLLASQSITPDNIDVAEATRLGIPVTVVPAIVTESTADIQFGLMLAVARRIVEGDRLARQGIFPGSQSNHLAGSAVYGKTIGLIGGSGRIGKAVARRANGFGMRILYWAADRLTPEEEAKLSISFVPLDELLAESDFISLHVALSPQTRHLIGARELALMKRTAFLINTSRGPVIDEAALVQALKQARISGAGLDVFEHEPSISAELVGMPNVVLTPHLGSADLDLREKMASVVIDNIEAMLKGRRPPHCLNPETLRSG